MSQPSLFPTPQLDPMSIERKELKLGGWWRFCIVFQWQAVLSLQSCFVLWKRFGQVWSGLFNVDHVEPSLVLFSGLGPADNKLFKVELSICLIYIIVLNSIWHPIKVAWLPAYSTLGNSVREKASLENTRPPAYYLMWGKWKNAQWRKVKQIQFEKRPARLHTIWCFSLPLCLPMYLSKIFICIIIYYTGCFFNWYPP